MGIEGNGSSCPLEAGSRTAAAMTSKRNKKETTARLMSNIATRNQGKSRRSRKKKENKVTFETSTETCDTSAETVNQSQDQH